ncbi:sialate O-acetylesterase [Pseudoxanthomonas indica]|nr:sialate O-acetylesterase [Pseudoxanthomonas indica]
MVLQRDQPIRVWGSAQPGEAVQVSLDGRQASTTTAADGRWSLQLPAHAAGGPYVLEVRATDGTQRFQNVLIGDVWLASGQSNMEWPLSQTAHAQAEIAAATDPAIRHFKVPKSWASQPQAQLTGGHWVPASPQVAGEFSAVAHLFARELHARTGVPIGIIDSTWGGSRIEPWMDAARLQLDAAALAQKMEQVRANDERALSGTRERLARFGALPAKDSDWQRADLDESAWQTIAVPGNWEQGGFAGMDGIAWYRSSFELSAAQAAEGVQLSFARVDDSDQTWVNGVAVGATHRAYNTPRIYNVPANALHAGRNVIAVRVEDEGGGGGIHGNADELYVHLADDQRLPLAREWKFRVASASVQAIDDKNQIATLLYNQMIHPLQPYALRGVIWYQGEANANTAADALAYRRQFPQLIAQWRRQWQQPELPFLWVQLASFVSGFDQGDSSPWSLLRESQSATLSVPHTGQAVTIDIGEAHDIHPRNKQDVAKRLALAARAVAYGETVQASGPIYAGADFADGQARVRFAEGSGTLASRQAGQALHGFALAGADHRFHPAQARIVGDQIIVSSEQVRAPAAVRYGWHDNVEAADLINSDGLPAAPFRSDDW